MAELSSSRAGRLQWLAGERKSDAAWDAFEAPSGTSLSSWVRARTQLSWQEMRELLRGLAQELDVALKEERSGRLVSIDHVWITGYGHAKLLDFPAALGETGEPHPISSWQNFLHQVALFGLEGRFVRAASLDFQAPAVPLPEHARPIVGLICDARRAAVSTAAVVANFRHVAGRPARLSRGGRAWTRARRPCCLRS
jgi:hypothetical protein